MRMWSAAVTMASSPGADSAASQWLRDEAGDCGDEEDVVDVGRGRNRPSESGSGTGRMRVLYIVEGEGGYKEWLKEEKEAKNELLLNWEVGRKGEQDAMFERQGKGRCTTNEVEDKYDEKGRNERARRDAVQRAGR